MFNEQWSIIIVNALSLIGWMIRILAFCSSTKKNCLILYGTASLVDITMYAIDNLWYPVISSLSDLTILIHSAFFRFHNLIFNFTILIIAIIANFIKIGGIHNVNIDNILPIIGFSISVMGTTCVKSMHILRIFYGAEEFVWLYYNLRHNILFASAQDLFVILLMISDILLKGADNKVRSRGSLN